MGHGEKETSSSDLRPLSVPVLRRTHTFMVQFMVLVLTKVMLIQTISGNIELERVRIHHRAGGDNYVHMFKKDFPTDPGAIKIDSHSNVLRIEVVDANNPKHHEPKDEANDTLPSERLFKTPSKPATTEPHLFMRVASQTNILGEFTFKAVDRKYDFVEKNWDRGVFAIPQRYLERPFMLMFTARGLLSKGPKYLEFATSSHFSKSTIKFSAPIQVFVAEIAKELPPLIKFVIEGKQAGSTQPEVLNKDNMKAQKVEPGMAGSLLFKEEFGVTVNQTLSAQVNFVPLLSTAQVLEHIELRYDYAELGARIEGDEKVIGRLVEDATDSPSFTLAVQCWQQGNWTLSIYFRFVGDISYLKNVTVNCVEAVPAKLTKDESPFKLERPTEHRTGIQSIDISLTGDYQYLAVDHVIFTSTHALTDLRLNTLVKNGVKYLEKGKPAFIEYSCLPLGSQDQSVVSLFGTVYALGKSFPIMASVVCIERQPADWSLMLKICFVIVCIMVTTLAVIFSGAMGVKLSKLKSTKLPAQMVQPRRRMLEIVDLEKAQFTPNN